MLPAPRATLRVNVDYDKSVVTLCFQSQADRTAIQVPVELDPEDVEFFDRIFSGPWVFSIHPLHHQDEADTKTHWDKGIASRVDEHLRRPDSNGRKQS